MQSFGNLSDIKTVERIGWATLGLPLVPVIALVIYGLIAWYQFGHFPSYGNPDPKEMGPLSTVVQIGMFLSPYLWCLSFCSLIFLVTAGLQQRKTLRYLIIALLVGASYLGFMSLDPLGLVNWIGD